MKLKTLSDVSITYVACNLKKNRVDRLYKYKSKDKMISEVMLHFQEVHLCWPPLVNIVNITKLIG